MATCCTPATATVRRRRISLVVVAARGGGEGGLGGISPAAGGDTGTDASVDALTQPLNATTASQAVPKVQGYYVSLLGNLLYEWRQLSRMARGSNVPEENNDFSSWGNEARW